jgi:hypothetical protein
VDKSVLRELFDGKIYPSECIKPDTPEYRAALKVLEAEKEYFFKTLSGEDNKKFKRTNDLYFEIIDIYSYESFVYGFRLAVALMSEALGGKKEQTQNDKK